MKPLAAALPFLLLGCSANTPAPAPEPAAPAVEQGAVEQPAAEQPAAADAPPSQAPVRATGDAPARLAVGEVLEVALEGNAGTGYAWELVADGAPLLALQDAPAPAPAPATGADTPPVVGGIEVQRWHFKALQPGETTLRLAWRRAWEQDAAPAREAEFRVVVEAPPPG